MKQPRNTEKPCLLFPCLHCLHSPQSSKPSASEDDHNDGKEGKGSPIYIPRQQYHYYRPHLGGSVSHFMLKISLSGNCKLQLPFLMPSIPGNDLQSRFYSIYFCIQKYPRTAGTRVYFQGCLADGESLGGMGKPFRSPSSS